jgi:ketosteroid isomerase-like protein
VKEAAARFYRAFLGADREALAALVAPEVAWVLPMESAISGEHVGPDGIAALRRRIGELTDGTWSPLRSDSFDVAVSEWHAVVMDRYLAERGARRLDSHEAVVLAMEDGVVRRIFHYVHDPAAFAAFWN